MWRRTKSQIAWTPARPGDDFSKGIVKLFDVSIAGSRIGVETV